MPPENEQEEQDQDTDIRSAVTRLKEEAGSTVEDLRKGLGVFPRKPVRSFVRKRLFGD